MNFLCWLGFHKWHYEWNQYDKHFKWCGQCGKKIEL